MISIILNLLRLILWSNIKSILENVPCILEKNICSEVVEWNVLYMSVRSVVLFKSCFVIDSQTGCPSIVESRVLKFPAIILLLFIFLYSSVSNCFLYLGALILGA